MIEKHVQNYVELFKESIEKILYSNEAFKQVESLIEFFQQDENQLFVKQYLTKEKFDAIELFFIKDNLQIQINNFNAINAYSLKISPAHSIGRLNILFNQLLTNQISFSDSKEEIIDLIQSKLNNYYEKLYLEILKDNFFENLILDTNHNYLLFKGFIPISMFDEYINNEQISTTDCIKKIECSTTMEMTDTLIYFLKKDKISIITEILDHKNNVQLTTAFIKKFDSFIDIKFKKCQSIDQLSKLVNHYYMFFKYSKHFDHIIKDNGYTLVMSNMISNMIHYKQSVQLLNYFESMTLNQLIKYDFSADKKILITDENKSKWIHEVTAAIKLNLIQADKISEPVFIKISSSKTRENIEYSDYISILTSDNVLY